MNLALIFRYFINRLIEYYILMESSRYWNLPSIFKLSTLCNILPYYGYLHEWRFLLGSINTETLNIWDKNRDQLIYFGRFYKKEMLNEEDNKNAYERIKYLEKTWIDLFSFSFSSYILWEVLVNLYIFTAKLEMDRVIIIDYHSDLFKEYQLHYWGKDDIHKIVPAVLCPLFKYTIKTFKHPEMYKLKYIIQNESDPRSIVIENLNEEVMVYSTFSYTLKITPYICLISPLKNRLEIDDSSKLCKLDDWEWKPKNLRVWCCEFSNLIMIHDKFADRAKTLNCQFGYQSKSFWSANHKLIKKKWIYKVLFDLDHRKSEERFTEFIFPSKKLLIITQGKILEFRLNNNWNELKLSEVYGKQIIQSQNNNSFAMKIDLDIGLKLILEENSEIDNTNEDFFVYLKDISNSNKDCYMIFEKKYIAIKSNLNKINVNTSILKFFSKAYLKIDSETKPNAIVKIFNHFQKDVEYILEIDDVTLIFKLMRSLNFRKKVNEFNAKFKWEGIYIKPHDIENRKDQKDFESRILKERANKH